MSVLQDIEDFPVEGELMNAPLPLGPEGVLRTGVLNNGLRYYARQCNKPKERAALKLVVRVGSIVEEEHERGVAHIVEHLAFSASEAHSNHEVVEKLEALGSAFGPCQNAYTGVEETTYELLIPTDDATILPQALAIFREFAFKIRCGDQDLERERGPVLEEWRSGRNAAGRAAEAHWQLMLKNSRYAERLPIGLESVIKTVSAATVRGFYGKWYHPEHMAIVAVGHFADLDHVVACIAEQLGGEGLERGPAPPLPDCPWSPHEDLYCKIFSDKEASQALVFLHYKSQSPPLRTPADFLQFLKVELLHFLLNRRFSAVCQRQDAPFYMAQVGREALVQNCAADFFSITAFEGRLLPALEGVLTEIARLRVHGVSERELEIAKAEYLMNVENMYLERDQEYATDLAGEYARHFTTQELVIGAEAEARLSKTLVGLVTMADVLAAVRLYRSTSSCVIKVQQHAGATSEDEIREVVKRVDEAEASGAIEAWSQEEAPEHLLEAEPEPGTVVSVTELPALGAKELLLGNGMRVSFRRSDALEDQVLLSGFAPGGLSDVPRAAFRTANFAPLLAGELGMFGFKPHVLHDVLVGKRVDLRPGEGAFWRTLSGEQSPLDMATALQMIYKLFTHEVVAVESELQNSLAMARQMVEAQLRNPMQRFVNHVRHLNYSRCYYFTPVAMKDLEELDVHAACRHFSHAFRNPAEFTLCFVGNVDEAAFTDLVRRYLASIPAQELPAPKAPADLTQLKFDFPVRPVQSTVALDLIEPIAQVQITFPCEVAQERAAEDGYWAQLICKLVEQRVLRKLRFDKGDVYSCSVSPFFGCEAPSRRGPVRGDIAISFTCAPEKGAALAQVALAEVAMLQREGPSTDEVGVVLNLEQRAHESSIQENVWWLDMLALSYQSRQFRELGSADAVFRRRQEARLRMREEASPETFKAALCRLLPCPCTARYTVVTTSPHTPWTRLVDAVTSHRVVCGLLMGAVLAGAWFMWRLRRH